MTEEEWFREIRSRLNRVSARKARLFAAACCRRVWDLMTDDRHRAAVVAFEHFADGTMTEAEYQAILAAVISLWAMLPPATTVEWDSVHYLTGATRHLVGPRDASHVASYAARSVARVAGSRSSPEWGVARDLEGIAQRELIEDITGQTASPFGFHPEWRTSTAVSLASQMYESRDFSTMPILADALQDAGCDDADILGHCRGSGPHARGCWVVDLVLGKE